MPIAHIVGRIAGETIEGYISRRPVAVLCWAGAEAETGGRVNPDPANSGRGMVRGMK